MDNDALNIPVTPMGRSYWDETGEYEKEYNELYQALVPKRGSADNLFGEVIRAVSRLSYEYYNNGNTNACDIKYIENWETCSYCGGDCYLEDEDGEEYPCPDCGGDGGWDDEEEGETEITDFYAQFLELLEYFFKEYMPAAVNLVEEVANIILAGRVSFSEKEERPYVLITDAAVYTILQNITDIQDAATESPALPSWYKRD